MLTPLLLGALATKHMTKKKTTSKTKKPKARKPRAKAKPKAPAKEVELYGIHKLRILKQEKVRMDHQTDITNIRVHLSDDTTVIITPELLAIRLKEAEK